MKESFESVIVSGKMYQEWVFLIKLRSTNLHSTETGTDMQQKEKVDVYMHT